ncbi:LEA type 2 family protein [Ectothiorhodospiraceae bacterium 2226]|nr:LEA type 2 family protein [Ectothiorhodospiraceae bacterium 2226]
MNGWMRWAAAAGLLALGGCAAVQEYVQDPQVELRDVRVVSMSLAQAQVAFDFDVHNPNRLGVSLRTLSYQLELQDRPFISGSHDQRLHVGANDTSRLTLPITLNYAEMLDSLRALGREDRVSYRLSGEAQLGPFKVPYSQSGTLPVPRLPEVSVRSLQVEALGLAGAQLALGVQVKNANQFPLRLNGFNYDLQLAGASLARGESSQPLDIAQNEAGMVQLRVWLDYSQLGELTQLLRQARALPVAVAGNVRIPGPTGEVVVPYSWNGEVPLTRR